MGKGSSWLLINHVLKGFDKKRIVIFLMKILMKYGIIICLYFFKILLFVY